MYINSKTCIWVFLDWPSYSTKVPISIHKYSFTWFCIFPKFMSELYCVWPGFALSIRTESWIISDYDLSFKIFITVVYNGFQPPKTSSKTLKRIDEFKTTVEHVGLTGTSLLQYQRIEFNGPDRIWACGTVSSSTVLRYVPTSSLTCR